MTVSPDAFGTTQECYPQLMMATRMDVMVALGIPPGPAVGKIIAALFERVLDDPDVNSRESLLAIARELPADVPFRKME